MKNIDYKNQTPLNWMIEKRIENLFIYYKKKIQTYKFNRALSKVND